MRVGSVVAVASCVASTFAFPAQHLGELEKRGLLSGLLDLTSGLLQTIEKDLEGVLNAIDIIPNKPIDVSGQHEWQAPKSTDQRGPCPGLNAMANHGKKGLIHNTWISIY